jgi:hypothetical protein
MHESGMLESGMHESGMHESGMHETGMHESGMHESGMHEILHLVDLNLKFGPLNCNNSFQSKELNRKIIRLIPVQDLIGDKFLKLFSVLQALTFFLMKMIIRSSKTSMRRIFEASMKFKI